MSLHDPIRYQLKKDAVRALGTGHPWIFRSHMSTAAEAFQSGQWLRLVNEQNSPVGYGIFEKEGLVAIRVLKEGPKEPTPDFFSQRVDKALAKRTALRAYTNAFRAIHGENDGIPGVVVDVYDDTAVLQTYVRSVDIIGRLVGSRVANQLKLKNLIWKLPAKRKAENDDFSVRLLRGTPPGVISIKEGKLKLSVDPWSGQKSGAFLDLRGLRKWIAAQKLAGARVLNLFCYTGTLGLAAEIAGAKEIWNVDIAEGALEAAKKYHCLDRKKHKHIQANIFDWLEKLPLSESFDLIIVDPPQMASRSEQVPSALKAYQKLFRLSAKHLRRGGTLIGCCCTSRIARPLFVREVEKTLAPQIRLFKSLGAEDDHPVGFPEGDYLKLLIFK